MAGLFASFVACLAEFWNLVTFAILVMFPTLRPNDTPRVLILTLFLYSPGFLDDDAASSQ